MTVVIEDECIIHALDFMTPLAALRPETEKVRILADFLEVTGYFGSKGDYVEFKDFSRDFSAFKSLTTSLREAEATHNNRP